MAKLTISTSIVQSQIVDLLPCNKYKKSRLIHSMISNFSLLESFDKVNTDVQLASREQLTAFHSREYVNTILNSRYNCVLPFDQDEESWAELNQIYKKWRQDATHTNDDMIFPTRDQLALNIRNISKISKTSFNPRKRTAWDALLDNNESNGEVTVNVQDSKKEHQLLQSFNLEGDCPVFSYLPLYCQVVSWSSLSLLDSFTPGQQEKTIAINWDGGRHHASKQRASGFCYVNDIVLLIQQLRKKGFQKISYVDFDLHHGDGVEKAFQFSENIQTISVHLFEPGFFPCTGSLEDCKKGRNVFNIPVQHGLDDIYFEKLVKQLVIPLITRHEPEVLVIQCGGDGLRGDDYSEWQLTIRGLASHICDLLQNTPNCDAILFGGGGYNPTLMSRFYTYLTWRILKAYATVKPLLDLDTPDLLIPETEFTEYYEDEYFKFWIYDEDGGGKMKELKNYNKDSFLSTLKATFSLT